MFTHGAGALGREYANTANDRVKVLVQIESKQGVENVEEIAAVEGLDFVFIGYVSRQEWKLCMEKG
jgi:4-hydroxy-2-oxoheptanedioate aldolase